MQKKDIYKLPAMVLFCIGWIDLFRGVMHTFFLNFSAQYIAQINLHIPGCNQGVLMGMFGVSNYLTAFLYFMIVHKARELSPYILIIIPLTYLLGVILIKGHELRLTEPFLGRYGMYGYFIVCIMTFFVFLIQKRKVTSLYENRGKGL